MINGRKDVLVEGDDEIYTDEVGRYRLTSTEQNLIAELPRLLNSEPDFDFAIPEPATLITKYRPIDPKNNQKTVDIESLSTKKVNNTSSMPTDKMKKAEKKVNKREEKLVKNIKQISAWSRHLPHIPSSQMFEFSLDRELNE